MDLKTTLQNLTANRKKLVDHANEVDAELRQLNTQITEYNGAISLTQQLISEEEKSIKEEKPDKLIDGVAETLKAEKVSIVRPVKNRIKTLKQQV